MRRDFADNAPPAPIRAWASEHNITHVIIWCGNWLHGCNGKARIALTDLDQNMTLGEMAKRMRCRRCGCKGADVRPDWPYPKMGLR